ncbi:MAG: hypothetical protein ACE5FU_14190 [Nitrospinota bacterium]
MDRELFSRKALLFLVIFFIAACGGGETFKNESGPKEGADANRWESKKIIEVEDAGGILSPRVKAYPGKNGGIHLAYFSGKPNEYFVRYAFLDPVPGNPVVSEIVVKADNSSGVSLAVDTNDIPAIAYQAGEVREAGQPGQSDAMFSLKNTQWREYTAGIGFVSRNPVFKDGLAGSSLSTAFDSKGNLHMVYQFRYEGIDALNYAYPDLLYIKKNRNGLGVDVSEETVEGNIFTPGGGATLQNNIGDFCTISMDNNDLPVAFYYAETVNLAQTGLKVAYKRNGTWVSKWIEDKVKIGGISKARLDKNGNLAVAYFVKESQDGEKNFLRYAYQNSPDEWKVQMVDDSIHGGRYPSLSFDSSGKPAIAYYAEMTYGGRELQDLRLARFNGTAWKHEEVATSGNAGLYNNLMFDEEDNPLIVSYSGTQKAIFLYSFNP